MEGRTREATNLGAVDPCRWAETHTISKGIDEDENDAGVVGCTVDIVGVCKREGAVDLEKKHDQEKKWPRPLLGLRSPLLDFNLRALQRP